MAQPDQLTLSVDVANDGNPVSEVYSSFQSLENRTRYIGDGSLPDNRDELAIYRTFATKSGNFKGVGKTAVKLTQDVDVAGVDSSTTITAPIILDLSFSVPVGASTADVVHARQRMIALLDDDTFMNKLNIQLMV